MDLEPIWEEIKMNNELSNEMNNLNMNNDEKSCCGSRYAVINEGYEVCQNCGLVSETKILEDNIYTFSNGDNNQYLRTFGSYLFPVSSNSTVIGGYSNIAKLNAWNSMPYNEKMLWEVSNEIKSKLGLLLSDKIISESLALFKQFYEKTKSFRGNNKKGFVAVCVYLASSNNFCPVSPKEIANALDVELKAVYKAIQKYSEIMGNRENITTSLDFLNHFCNILGLEFKVQKKISKILKVIEENCILSSSTPQNICIATVVFVCKEMGFSLNMKMVSEEFNVSLSTLDKFVNILKIQKQHIFKLCAKK